MNLLGISQTKSLLSFHMEMIEVSTNGEVLQKRQELA